jgi:hypothetical protein
VLRCALLTALLVLVMAPFGMALALASDMEEMGIEGEYPDLSPAPARARAQLSQLLRQTKANTWRFDTISKAQALGYSFRTAEDAVIGWPALRHMRKHGNRFWGRVLDPKAPQSLVWWCPSQGNCTLVAAMYRAPRKVMPPMYFGMLMWHRHGPNATWMTHVWLTNGLREALARCAPINALSQYRHITFQSYHVDADIGLPCSDTAPLVPSQAPVASG